MSTEVIASKQNPWFKQLRQQAQDNTLYKRSGRLWLEGDHLIQAALDQGLACDTLVLSDAPSSSPGLAALVRRVPKVRVVSAELFATLSQLPSGSHIGALVDCPAPQALKSQTPTVVLDRIQDVGNLGSILRSAAAFGIRQVLTLRGSAAVWSAKAVRAGMGAHFALNLHEDMDAQDLQALSDMPWIATSSHEGQALSSLKGGVPWPGVWFFGHEGQGLSAELASRCSVKVQIPQPGGQESLNVAAAAAICFYESSRNQGSPL
jgi:TrmH family RNA methyltransferase